MHYSVGRLVTNRLGESRQSMHEYVACPYGYGIGHEDFGKHDECSHCPKETKRACAEDWAAREIMARLAAINSEPL